MGSNKPSVQSDWKLFHLAGARSSATLFLLSELGVTVDVVEFEVGSDGYKQSAATLSHCSASRRQTAYCVCRTLQISGVGPAMRPRTPCERFPP